MAEEMFETDDVVAAEDSLDKIFKEKGSVVGFVKERYKRSEDSRYADEQRWLKAYRNYRGLYGSDVQFTDAEKSRVFVKVTKTKTLAAYGQIVDVLFGNNKFPLTVNRSVLPDGVAESLHINIDPNADAGASALRVIDNDFGSPERIVTLKNAALALILKVNKIILIIIIFFIKIRLFIYLFFNVIYTNLFSFFFR